MGGFGSGREAYGRRATVEESLSIDIMCLQRGGRLVPGSWGRLCWSDGDEQTVVIGTRAEDGAIVLVYQYRVDDGPWKTIEDRLEISWVRCHVGGRRPYFVCPGMGKRCGRRAVRLYLGDCYFRCRTCQDLGYSSQLETPHERALRRANGIRVKLGGEPGMTAPFPSRKKHMHRRTYGRLCVEALAAEEQARKLLFERLGRL